jgi:Tol biopolymer transport system component
MVRLYRVLLGAVSLVLSVCADEPLHVLQKNKQMSVMPAHLSGIGLQDSHMLDEIAHCLSFTGQFRIEKKVAKHVPRRKRDIKALFDTGYPIAIFIVQRGQKIEWRVYDTIEGAMVKGAQIHNPDDLRLWGRQCADAIWYALTSQKSPFLTRIAYVKKNEGTKRRYDVCVNDFDGKRESILFSTPRVIVAPSWGAVKDQPLLFFSEFTSQNVRLRATDLSGRMMTIFDFDGTSVGIASHPDRDEVVYCRSGMVWRYTYDADAKKGVHRLLVRGTGACASPNLLANGDVIYCARGNICCFNAENGKSSIIMREGYCVAPSYHADEHKIVYAKRKNGVMQLFTCDLRQMTQKQITDDASNKTDPSWSPCGAFVVYNVRTQDQSSIESIHIPTGKRCAMSRAGDESGYPTWSPMYTAFPVV